jgi:drug/metabolite transporter (DMT)-like permease
VALSVLFLHRVFGKQERIGICLSFAGIALIAVPPVLRATDAAQYYGSDDEVDTASSADALDQIGGILSTLIGAFGFGCFQVFWPMFDGRRYSAANPAPTNPVDAIIDTFATLSLVGAFLLSTGWVVLLFFHLLGWETFEVPPESIRGALLFSTVLTAVVDALNGIACVIASAMVVALCYPLMIPLSVVMQVFFYGIPMSEWGVLGWIGTVLVVAGVFCLEANGEDGESDGDVDNGLDLKDLRNTGSYIELEEGVGVYA